MASQKPFENPSPRRCAPPLSTDGGENWLQQEINIPGDIHAMQFLDARQGWLTGDRGALMHTTDGGATWEAVETNESVSLNGLYFISPVQGWIVGDYGVILSCEIAPP